MPEKVCDPGQIGPFLVFKNENMVSSYNAREKEYEFKEVCLDGTYHEVTIRGGPYGIIKTKHLELKGFPIDGRLFNQPWSKSNPNVPNKQFALLQTAYTLETYINYLSALSVYIPNIKCIFSKMPIDVEVGTIEFPNAYFSPWTKSLFFGYKRNECQFGADKDVTIHEFNHFCTNVNNPQMGTPYKDEEGHSIHETGSDIGAAIESNDRQMAEDVAKCMGVSDRLSPDIGIRDVGADQHRLYYEKEPHQRSELYSPLLWFSFKDMIKLCNGDLKKAKDIMTILDINMTEFIPSMPKKFHFAKALHNALYELETDPNFKKTYNFDTNAFRNIIKTNKARGWDRLFDTKEEKNEAFKKYPYVKDIEAVLKRFSVNDITFQFGYKCGRQTFFLQYHKGYPVVGHGIRFIATHNGIQMVKMIWEPPKSANTKRDITPKTAWKKILERQTAVEVAGMLSPQIKLGAASKGEINDILLNLNRLRGKKMPGYKLVFIPGKENLQYEFKIKGVITFYIDAVDGNISELARQKFY